MEDCFNGISIPEGVVEPCGGEYKSTDCILSPLALTYLGLPENASQTQINLAIQASLRAKDELVDEIDGSETKLSAGINITITGDGTAVSPYVVNAVGGAIPDGSETKVTAGTNTTVSGSGTVASPYVVGVTGLAPVATSGDYNDLINTPAPIALPDTTSDLTNDGSDGINPFITALDLPPAITSTSDILNDGATGVSTYVEDSELSPVATSGDYNDLSNTPAAISQDNFVRVLAIQETDLNGIGSIEQQICDYILALPEAQRTILDTDSKWNVQIVPQEGGIFTEQFTSQFN